MQRIIICGINSTIAALMNLDRQIEELYLTDSTIDHQKDIFDKIIDIANSRNIKINYISESTLDKITNTHSHQNIGLLCYQNIMDVHDMIDQSDHTPIIMLDNITDPANLGSIIRLMANLGIKNLVFSKHNSVPLTSTVTKVASGGLEMINISEVTNLGMTIESIKKSFFMCYGFSEHAEETWIDAQDKCALIFGSEEKGLRPLVSKKCDKLYKLNSNPAFPSMNVSHAICLTLSKYC